MAVVLLVKQSEKDKYVFFLFPIAPVFLLLWKFRNPLVNINSNASNTIKIRMLPDWRSI